VNFNWAAMASGDSRKSVSGTLDEH
jgi:hypothetical protein